MKKERRLCDYLTCMKPATKYCTVTIDSKRIRFAAYCLHHAVEVKKLWDTLGD